MTKLEFNTIYNEGIMKRGILRNACRQKESEALKQAANEDGVPLQDSITVYLLASIGIAIVFGFVIIIVLNMY